MLYDEEITARCGWEMCEQLDHKHCISKDIFLMFTSSGNLHFYFH